MQIKKAFRQSGSELMVCVFCIYRDFFPPLVSVVLEAMSCLMSKFQMLVLLLQPRL